MINVSKNLADHVAAAERAQHWLRQRGSCVVELRIFPRRPVLEIAGPPVELVNRAARITESCRGGTRSVWVATVENCQIIWR